MLASWGQKNLASSKINRHGSELSQEILSEQSADEQKGMYDQAVVEWQRMAASSGRAGPEVATAFQKAYAQFGYPGVLRMGVELAKLAPPGPVRSSGVAIAYAQLGKKDEAFQSLERAWESHTRDLIYLNVEPQYDPIRGDPRFADLVRRIGLPAR